jgi:hypothetical protein
MTRLRGTDQIRRVALIWLGVVAAIAGLGLFATLIPRTPSANTLRYEVMRACLQVLGISLIGVVVAMATFRLQQVHSEQSKLDAEERDNTLVTKRREDDRELDERRRLDDRVTDFLSETINAYNAVKSVRRLLQAETGPKADARITRVAYSKLMTVLCDQQLIFESLYRRAPLIQDRVKGGIEIRVTMSRRSADESGILGTLADYYGRIESYLNEIVDEFQKNLHVVPSDGGVSLRDLGAGKLSEFIHRTSPLKENVSYIVESIIRCLESDLLTSRTPLSGAAQPRR